MQISKNNKTAREILGLFFDLTLEERVQLLRELEGKLGQQPKPRRDNDIMDETL